MKTTSILLAGVGGQGVVAAGDVLAKALLYSAFDVKKSEIHGMAQRGGSVFSHVRFGGKVHSPVIPEGCADFIVSFEKMEFLRYLQYANETTILLLSSTRIFPLSVNMGEDSYPEEVVEKYKSSFASCIQLDAEAIATEFGNRKLAGTVLLARLSEFLPITFEAWQKAVTSAFHADIAELNLAVFNKIGKFHEDNKGV
ncbi:MAG: indolepyruvate oxidoreductase subunit beta [Deferribacteraceae bacterium]|jgi:indolepyruvate ferredoxin oxidoreductase beta subunit|nr:indolepyruvate oxidoreductase subunit beta [Deferribacteraceae bacterium]